MGGAAALWAALVVGSVAPAAATPLPLAKPAATSSAAAPVSPAPSVPGSSAPSEDGPAVADPAPAVAAVPIPVTPGAPAKVLFGQVMTPAAMQARSIGFYSRGCLAGAKALPVDGATWQVMRLSRNRNWGHPALIAYLEKLAAAAPSLGWRGLLVGDLAQPRGGPMLTGHASHQIGLDADIWLTPMPDRRLSAEEREAMSAVSMLDESGLAVDPAKWTPAHLKLIRRAASDPRVARIFVHPAIKKTLCERASGDRSWLRKVRPYWGHHYHFHVRISCPAGMAGCRDQDPPPPGDGCGAPVADWLALLAKPAPPVTKPAKPKPPMPLSALPAECRQVIVAP